MSNHPLVVNIRDCSEDEGVYIGRPSPWGNPFLIPTHGNRAQVLKKHSQWLDGIIPGPNGEKPPTLSEIRKYLSGQKLKCFCNPKRCHGHALAVRANPKRGLFR